MTDYTNSGLSLLGTGGGGGGTTTVIVSPSTDTSNYYTKSQIDNTVQTINTNISTKQSITDCTRDYYNKVSIDASLNLKQDKTAMTNYYTKTNIDSSLNLKQDKTDIANYYNKPSIDTTINTINSTLSAKQDKADMSNYYNKTTTDTELNKKQDKTDMINYYNKTYIDTTINTINTTLANNANTSAIPSLTGYFNRLNNSTTDTFNYISFTQDSLNPSQLNFNYSNLLTYLSTLSSSSSSSPLPSLANYFNAINNSTVDADNLIAFHRDPSNSNQINFNYNNLKTSLNSKLGSDALTNYYTKTNIDNQLTTINTALGNKANTSDIPNLTNYFNAVSKSQQIQII